MLQAAGTLTMVSRLILSVFMDRRRILRMTKTELVEFASEYSTWIGPGRLEDWSKDELVGLCLETLERPPLSEEQRAGVRLSRSQR